MNYLIACPNCYRSQPWSGDLEDVACQQCGRAIPVQAMARSLAHLFSTAAFDPPHDALADEEGDALFTWIAGRVWGDAMRVGRHDWVYAGCPVSIDDFCAGIESLDGAALDSLGRLLSAGTPPEVLSQSAGKIGHAAARRLAALIERGPEPIAKMGTLARRERLYDILSRYPSVDAVPVLQRITSMYPTMDGDTDRTIGAVLAEALERCRALGPEASPS